jgi:hypothetical protein
MGSYFGGPTPCESPGGASNLDDLRQSLKPFYSQMAPARDRNLESLGLHRISRRLIRFSSDCRLAFLGFPWILSSES